MVHGIGNDIIAVKRIEGVIERHGSHFLQKIFTTKEIAYCSTYKDSARHFAGRFAAKEAIVKALGIGFREGIGWLDIEVINDEKGKPQVNFSSHVQEMVAPMKVLVSISHCHEYASAFAIVFNQQ